jgi:hypothetical protein
MPDLVTVVPFALVGVAMVVFGLVLNHQGTLSARRLDRMARGKPSTAEQSFASARTTVAVAIAGQRARETRPAR